MKTKNLMPALCLVLAAAALTSGCAAVAVGGVVATGAVSADRRTAGAQVDDQAIDLKARTAIDQNLGEGKHISITSYNRRVLLTGEVASEADRQRAEQLTSQVENVRVVYNQLAVMPVSSFSERSNDTWITSKVRSEILRTDDLPSKSLKVSTERSVVYLQGLVTRQEAQAATQAARSVSGVEKVVTIFEFISAEDLQKTVAEREAREAEMPASGEHTGAPQNQQRTID